MIKSTNIRFVDFIDESNEFVFNDDNNVYTLQELADLISFAHSEKVLKDNEIKRIYNRGTEEPR